VSLLKPAPSSTSAGIAALPDPDNMLQILERVLQTRLHHRGPRTVQ
jgi:glutathione synthase/RimK-type ligase-like ATP-grasp enzyme